MDYLVSLRQENGPEWEGQVVLPDEASEHGPLWQTMWYHVHREPLGISISAKVYTFRRALQHMLSLKHVLRAIKVNDA